MEGGKKQKNKTNKQKHKETQGDKKTIKDKHKSNQCEQIKEKQNARNPLQKGRKTESKAKKG